MAKKPSINIDLSALRAWFGVQFKGVNRSSHPSVWPPLPRYGLCALVTVGVFGMLWATWLNTYSEQLAQEQDKESKLREHYSRQMAKAVNLQPLIKQREQAQQYVLQLEKQLPSKAEMDALLSDITQAGLGRSLQFELFRPGSLTVKDYYAEQPIGLRVTGRYHDMGSFAADVASLPRIVTLNNLTLTPARDNSVLTLDATAKTFRYLDQEEIQAQRKAASAVGGKK